MNTTNVKQLIRKEALGSALKGSREFWRKLP